LDPASRWLVAENNLPEDRVLACLLITMDTQQQNAYFKHIAVDTSMRRRGKEDG